MEARKSAGRNPVSLITADLQPSEMSLVGQSRQTNTPDEFAACPLYLQLRLYRWTATNRREVPLPDAPFLRRVLRFLRLA